MITWLTKTWTWLSPILSKIWLWLKSYWYVPLLAIVGIFALFAGKTQWVFDLLNQARASYANQVTVIEDLAKKEKEEKERLQKQYEAAVAALEAKYAIDNKKLQEEEKAVIKKLVEENKDSPEALTQLLADTFGLKVI